MIRKILAVILRSMVNSQKLDNCHMCFGSRGGVKGNENVVDGIVLCDYCSLEYYRLKLRLQNNS
jgi:hypothetical protein